MRRQSRQSGFVLLMALVLVLLAGVTLAALARRSMVGAIRTDTAVEALKRRWAVRSSRATLLGRAEFILEAAERGAAASGTNNRRAQDWAASSRTASSSGGDQPPRYLNDPMPSLRVRCILAGIDYDLMLTDEQAKLNVNRVLERAGIPEAEAAASRLVAGATGVDGSSPALRLRSLEGDEETFEERGLSRKVGGYAQIFEKPLPHRLLGDGSGPGLAARITCWGDGKVNLRRASAEVVEEACRGELGPSLVRVLLAARDRDPYRDLAAMLSESSELNGLNEDQKSEIRRLVTTRSSCHGLWVIARTERRSWHTLAVEAGSDRTTFTW